MLGTESLAEPDFAWVDEVAKAAVVYGKQLATDFATPHANVGQCAPAESTVTGSPDYSLVGGSVCSWHVRPFGLRGR